MKGCCVVFMVFACVVPLLEEVINICAVFLYILLIHGIFVLPLSYMFISLYAML